MTSHTEHALLRQMRVDLESAVLQDLRSLPGRARPGSAPRVRRVALSAAIVAVVVLAGVVALPWGLGGGSGATPTAAAAIEQRLRGLEVVRTAGGETLDTTQASILGSVESAQGTLYLVTGTRLVAGIEDPCVGVLAPEALDETFSKLPDSALYFGRYSCGDGRGWGSGVTQVGEAAVGIYGSVSAAVTRVSLVGPSGAVDLPLHDGTYGTLVPYGQQPPTRVDEYGAGGSLSKSYPLEPQYFVKHYLPPDASSPHHTVIAETLPDGRPITVERTDDDRFGAYAFFLSIAGQPVKGALWEDDGPAGGPVSEKPDFWANDVLVEGDARVLLITTEEGATATASLSDGTRIPLEFQTISPEIDAALVVIPASQAAQTLSITGTDPDGSTLGSDTVDLSTATVVGLHERN